MIGERDMRAVVTGGAGFIGSALVRALVDAHADVTVVDDLSAGRVEELAPVRDRIVMVRADVRDPDALRAALGGASPIDVVFHLAADVSVSRSVEDPAGVHAVNATGTLNALIAARDAGVRRFVYSSSTSVYGEAEALPITEAAPTRPLSPYGASKLAGEAYCAAFTRSIGVPAVTLRYFNVYGPGQPVDSPYAAVIPRFVEAVLAGRPPTIFGDGLQTRDFVFVEDVVRANVLAASAPDRALGRAFNVASGAAATILDVARRVIEEASGGALQPVHAPARVGDIERSVADVTAARDALGFEAAVAFPDGLRRTVDWFRRRGG